MPCALHEPLLESWEVPDFDPSLHPGYPYWIFGEDFKTSTFLFFPFGPQTDRERNRTETVRIPNGSRTDPVRTPYGPRTPLERTPRGPRADPARTPREPRADPERTPNGPRTDPERTPNGPRGYEIFSETRLMSKESSSGDFGVLMSKRAER